MSGKGIRALPTLAAVLVVMLTVSLGNWQTRRAAEKLALQDARDQALALPPVALDAATLATGAQLVGRRVIAQGHFLEQYTVFVDNRGYRGQAGFHVVTPFQADGLAHPILVLRGWAAQDPADRSRLPSVEAAAGPLRVEGLAQTDLDQVLELAKAPLPGPNDRLWQNASIAAMSRWSGLVLAPLVLRQTGEAPQDGESGHGAVPWRTGKPLHADRPVPSTGARATTPSALATVPLVRDWPSPGAGVDKHRAYAFQWYSMAATVIVLWLVFFWRLRRTQS